MLGVGLFHENKSLPINSFYSILGVGLRSPLNCLFWISASPASTDITLNNFEIKVTAQLLLSMFQLLLLLFFVETLYANSNTNNPTIIHHLIGQWK